MHTGDYTELITIAHAYKDSVNCLAFSSQSNYLASGSDDGYLMVWDVSKGKSINKFELKSPVTSLLWMPTRSASLACGCLDGTIKIFHNVDTPAIKKGPSNVLLGVRAEVYCLDAEVASGHLAVGIGAEVHIAKEQTQATRAYASFSMLPRPKDIPLVEDGDNRVRPRSLHLLKDGTRIIVTYLSHGIVCWNFIQGAQLWQIMPTHTYGHLGSSALSPNARWIVVYNMHSAMDVYPLMPGSKPKRSFEYVVDEDRHLIMQVSFLHDGSAVVSGSPQGLVAIYSLQAGEHLQTLTHEGDIVQAIATSSTSMHGYIATAPLEKEDETYIKIWRNEISRTFVDMYLSPMLDLPLHLIRTDLEDHQTAMAMAGGVLILSLAAYFLLDAFGLSGPVLKRSATFAFQKVIRFLLFRIASFFRSLIDGAEGLWATAVDKVKVSIKEFLEI